MTTTINANTSAGLVYSADTSGIIKVQSNGVTTNALAWVNFDGSASSPIAPRAAYNISSVTRNSTGNFTLNFTTAMADANYAVAGLAGVGSAAASTVWGDQGTRTTSAYQFAVGNSSSGSNGNYNYINIIILGN